MCLTLSNSQWGSLPNKQGLLLSRATESLAPVQRLLPALQVEVVLLDTQGTAAEADLTHMELSHSLACSFNPSKTAERVLFQDSVLAPSLPVTCWPSWDCVCCVFGKNCLATGWEKPVLYSPREIPNCFCDKWLTQWNQLSPIWSFYYDIVTWVKVFYLNILNWIKRD